MTTEHDHDAHLEQDTEGVMDVLVVELLEALSTVVALEDEDVVHSGIGHALLEVALPSNKHQRVQPLLIMSTNHLLGVVGFFFGVATVCECSRRRTTVVEAGRTNDTAVHGRSGCYI